MSYTHKEVLKHILQIIAICIGCYEHIKGNKNKSIYFMLWAVLLGQSL